jgi:hypothetical protein
MRAFVKKIFLFITVGIIAFQLSSMVPVFADTPTPAPSAGDSPTPTTTITTTPTPSQNPSPTPIGSCNDAIPTAPNITSSDSGGAHSVVLTWTAVSAPVSYYLVSYGVSSGNYIYGNPNVGNVTSYTVGSLVTAKPYYFAVKAVNGCMPGAYSNEMIGIPGSSTPTPTISDLSGTDANPTSETSPTDNFSPTQGPPITPVPRPGAVNVEKTAIYSVIGVLLLISVVVLIIVNRSSKKPQKPEPPTAPPEPLPDDSPDQPPISNSSSAL